MDDYIPDGYHLAREPNPQEKIVMELQELNKTLRFIAKLLGGVDYE